MIINFTDPHLVILQHSCRTLGEARYTESQVSNRADQHGAKTMTPQERKQIHIMGAFAEAAAALASNKSWSMSINRFGTREPDIGERGQVRCRSQKTVSKGYKSLLIRPKDNQDQFYVLVHELEPCEMYDVIGGIEGRDGKTDAYKDFSKPYGLTFFVPPNFLAKDLKKVDF